MGLIKKLINFFSENFVYLCRNTHLKYEPLVVLTKFRYPFIPFTKMSGILFLDYPIKMLQNLVTKSR